jgi:hypothetical protein
VGRAWYRLNTVFTNYQSPTPNYQSSEADKNLADVAAAGHGLHARKDSLAVHEELLAHDGMRSQYEEAAARVARENFSPISSIFAE